MVGRCYTSQCIHLIVDPLDSPRELANWKAFVQHIKRFRWALERPIGQGGQCLAGKTFTFAPQAHAQHSLQALLVRIEDDASALWNGPEQVMELLFDGLKVFKNIGMIELQIIEHAGLWPIVNKLTALVEKSGVVFIGFDHKEGLL